MYITEELVTASIQIPNSFLLTPEQELIVGAHYPNIEVTVKDRGGIDLRVLPAPEPRPQPVEPTAEEKLRADVDFLAALQGVTL